MYVCYNESLVKMWKEVCMYIASCDYDVFKKVAACIMLPEWKNFCLNKSHNIKYVHAMGIFIMSIQPLPHSKESFNTYIHVIFTMR